ncbi:MAG TPA: hypothetical protein V6D25_03250 [Leptolyngbyaceae cyanobacterium]
MAVSFITQLKKVRNFQIKQGQCRRQTLRDRSITVQSNHYTHPKQTILVRKS